MKTLVLLTLALCAVAADHSTVPDPKLTPGATDPRVTQKTIRTTVCADHYTSTVRSVSASTKRAVMARYGLPASELRKVEVDHWLSLELGGSNDVANLWPQYYVGQAGYLGAREKDVVETHLAHAVCSGAMTLVQAQAAIRNWVEIYRSLKK